MAHVLYFPDGTRESLCGDTLELHEGLHRIIEERLGYEAADLFNEVSITIENNGDSQGDDYEAISDGYYQMLISAVSELDAILKQFKASRLNRQRLEASICHLRNEINSNI